MTSTVPPALAPYLNDCFSTRSLTLLTSTLGTPTNWLLVRLLCLALHGRDGKPISVGTKSTTTKTQQPPVERKVVFVSIWRSFELWNEIARKCGLNLRDEVASKQIVYVDGLPVPPSTSTSTSALAASQGTSYIPLPVPTLKALSATLSTLLPGSSQSGFTATNTTILMDGIDLLLAIDPVATPLSIQHFLTDLQSKVHNVIVTCAADEPLLHNAGTAATPLEYEHGVLIRGLGYQASCVIGLRELETGFSAEVDGTVRVGRGGGWIGGVEEKGDAAELEGGEWLFRVGGNGGVRVWGRGEA